MQKCFPWERGEGDISKHTLQTKQGVVTSVSGGGEGCLTV